ncbi:MAG: NTP transferase domain-containing protein, partial [Streptosporangiaceae bacterium]
MARNGPPRLAVILLAGGRARRMGGIDKPALLVGGRTLAARAA